jgi:ACS family 4-hydroxyphenylacetate permease-like MFS transporter
LIGGSATAESPSFIRAFVERIQKASPHWGTQVEKDCMMSIGQTLSIPHQDETASNEEIVMRKVWRRILLFGFLLLLFAQIDKHNIAFAGLTMSNDLGLTATTFGFCVSIFYVGYILCEIPSNLIMARVGARAWLARISITLGLASAITMLAVGFKSLLTIRFLLGMAEAGMIPGLLLYFTYWFPLSYRARANSWFLVAMPIAGVVASILSGVILDLNGALGLAGWQWLFLLLGMPPIILGLLAFFHLNDGPEKASWLSATERRLLATMLANEPSPQQSNQPGAANPGWARALFSRDVISLAIRALVSGEQFSLFGWIAAVPALAAAISMPLWSRQSDKHRERKWHIVIPNTFAVIGLLVTMSATTPWMKLAGLVMCSMGSYGGYGVFWSLVAQVIPERHRPAGIAMIHAFGSAGAILSPVIIGFLRDLTGNFSAGLLFAAGMLTVSIVLLVFIKDGLPKRVPLAAVGP